MGDVEQYLNETFSIFENHNKAIYLGEKVTIVQHSIQAAMQAEQDGQPTHVVLAALLHDIGHMLGIRDDLPKMVTDQVNIGTIKHEKVAADYLRERGFPDEIADLVELHVEAKRYRVAVDPSYELSEASTLTLVHQGGPMSEDEVAAFEARADKDIILKMREYDERAKDPAVKCKALGLYKDMCRQYLLSVN